ncbi:transcription-repair coupling factor [Texcoconibacillus texcoconensis]|uniref:Transcription-repair-coupling factor n=1 Tax=Texcoconibacillus texcoconensis TaxID=1095777 RepID=A0A840QUB7_9BACI|nr:transcription-repair coupling factor [Texcoconibacillus texcoconensis]MBB5174903.1 transcription-repair coupling factor (superfamily II helicase) [Texcoconibacillus texcoconensis]
MEGLHQVILKDDDIRSVIDGLDAGLKEQMVAGLTGSARTLLMASMYQETKRPQLVITHNLYQAQKLYDDLAHFVGDEHVHLYPVNELISSEIAVASPEMRGQRIEVLNKWVSNRKGIVITPLAGVRRLLPPKSVWQESQLSVHTGQILDLDKTLDLLVTIGYDRVHMVAGPGQFSVRGGIIDIFPLVNQQPIRIELFDDEVDSIRYFDADTQRSEQEIDTVHLGPADELVLYDEHFARGAEQLQAYLAESVKKTKDATIKEQLTENIRQEIDQLHERTTFDSIYKYVSLLYEQPATLLDYIPSHGMIFVDEMSRVQEVGQELDKEEANWQTTMLSQGAMVRDVNMSKPFEDLFEQAKQPLVYLSLFLRHVQNTQPQNVVNIQSKSMQTFHGQLHLLKSELDRWKSNNDAIVFVASDQERSERMKDVLEDYQMEAIEGSIDKEPLPGKAQILIGHLESGFELPLQNLVVITEEEVFTKKAKRPKRQKKMSNAERIKSYSELKVGDLVVHVNHGIGKYLGIETLEVNGVHKDYLHLTYAGNDKLYVPVEQIDQVQKYVGSEEKDPKLYSLGGSEWKKVKNKVQSSVEDIADDLIELYAERQSSQGVAFSPDGVEQREFESSFPYQETEDQMQAIEEIKADMEKSYPMDRLLCGDVGYGKTEVALRAAFKAIMEGKQVAFLVPTTILAQQHYETIRERFAQFAINAEMISRFRSRKEQKETIQRLKEGVVDVVVGTHRILSKDVKFKDLGLLIVDEEQRFGVTHKEKIKQLKANVDVLTLTATPIPRTLHMSMLGVRDLSVIETPPENRFPVQTYVVEYNPALVREAIEREMARGGQVYLLFNRVDEIESMADRISMLVPDANVRYAHGKMTETELESVMLDFLEGEADVLVTTTIIETGVDIPNVNTLIIYDADRMGLSQLYQLRGRVGRSNRVAYAYLTYQQDKVLTEVAEQRLQSIKEFTELGSGFKIAMRDLSIRGTGNLLGAQQHGFIASVGFDLYSQMLQDAIENRKKASQPEQETVEETEDIEVEMNVDAYIPESYIPDSKQKIDMYKRFKALSSLEDVLDLQNELIDRFGDYPEEVGYLLQIAKIGIYAKQEGIEKIQEKQQQCTILLSKEVTEKTDGAKLFTMAHDLSKKLALGMEKDQIKIVLKKKGLEQKAYLQIVEDLLSQLPEVKKLEDTASPSS